MTEPSEDQTPPQQSAEEILAAAQAKADQEAAEAEAAKAAADAKAEAEAQAAAQAKAAAEAKAKAAAKPIPPKPRKRKLDTAKLDYLARTIDQMNVTGHRLGLQDELIDLHGLKVGHDQDSGAVRLAMAGIEIDPAENMEMALTNWANAARRAIAETIG